METRTFEVIIIGGSYAGLSSALALGRSLRKVLIIDSGTPCNKPTPHSHNYLTQDGVAPEEIARIGLEQVLAYDTVQHLHDEVVELAQVGDEFHLKTSKGKSLNSGQLIFATGLKDHLPDIPGFAACWGKTAIHCPYCHGYEVRGKRTGILVNDPTAIDFAKLISNWTKDLQVFTDGPAQFDIEALTKLGIRVIETPIQHISHERGYMTALRLQDGVNYALEALYHRAPTTQQCDIPVKLGCQISETGHLIVDDFQRTSIPGIFAVGDCTTPFRSVAKAVAQGSTAGAIINHDLIAHCYEKVLS